MDIQTSYRNALGSKASRIPSPIKLIETTVKRHIIPAGAHCHG